MKLNGEIISRLQFRVKDYVIDKSFGCQIHECSPFIDDPKVDIVELTDVRQLDELVDVLSEMRAVITKTRMQEELK